MAGDDIRLRPGAPVAPMNAPTISVDDEAFRYGRGVFETVRVESGTAHRADWHEESMREAAADLGLDAGRIVPGPAPGGTGMWRWFLTPRQFFTTWEQGIPETPPAVELGLSALRASSASWEARHKTMSYLLMWQARKAAVSGWDVVLNEHGHLACATMANLFWLRAGVLHTPARACGCRAGTVRRWVMEAAGGRVREVAEGPEALDAAEAVFLTNCRIGLLPVLTWRGRSLPRVMAGGQPSAALRETLRSLIGG